MTANIKGRFSLGRLLGSMRVLRDYWLLIVFVASALFWVRDTYHRLVDIPVEVLKIGQAIEALRADVATTGAQGIQPVDLSPAVSFPGSGHSIEDGAAGQRVVVRLEPLFVSRADCRLGDVWAFMEDETGKWFSVATDLVKLPVLLGAHDIAFSVAIHPAMAEGAARFLLQIAQDCRERRRIVSTPKLPFRVVAVLTEDNDR